MFFEPQSGPHTLIQPNAIAIDPEEAFPPVAILPTPNTLLVERPPPEVFFEPQKVHKTNGFFKGFLGNRVGNTRGTQKQQKIISVKFNKNNGVGVCNEFDIKTNRD